MTVRTGGTLATRGGRLRVVILLAFVAACSGTTAPEVFATHTGRTDVVVYRPPEASESPTVVLFHDCCGDPADLGQLALGLAAAGVTVFNTAWTTKADGGGWPRSYEDIVCGIAFANERAAEAVRDPNSVVVVAWGDSALIASAAILSGRVGPGPACAAEERDVEIDAVVTLGGFFGWDLSEDEPARAFATGTLEFFGGDITARPVAWEVGNPYAFVKENSGVRFALVAGTDDDRLAQSESWFEALEDAGHTATLDVLPGDHFDLIAPRFPAGERVVELVAELAFPSESSSS